MDRVILSFMDEMQSFEYLEAVETWLRAVCVCVRFPLSWEMLCDSEWNETLCHSYMFTASSEKGVDIMKPLRVFFLYCCTFNFKHSPALFRHFITVLFFFFLFLLVFLVQFNNSFRGFFLCHSQLHESTIYRILIYMGMRSVWLMPGVYVLQPSGFNNYDCSLLWSSDFLTLLGN